MLYTATVLLRSSLRLLLQQFYLRKRLVLSSGSGRPNTEKVGTITICTIQEIAELQAADMIWC
ncbi:hypothetical protein ACT691_04775 [Vibrio metschnikovii]